MWFPILCVLEKKTSYLIFKPEAPIQTSILNTLNPILNRQPNSDSKAVVNEMQPLFL